MSSNSNKISKGRKSRSVSPDYNNNLRVGSADSYTSGGGSSYVGRYSDDRVKKRLDRQNVPDDDSVKEIMESVKPGSRSGQRLSPIRSNILTNDDDTVHNKNRQKKENLSTQYSILHKTPEARLGDEIKSAEDMDILGSSQRTGCQGDFCAVDLSALESGDTSDTPQDQSQLSAFRRRLIKSNNLFEDSQTSNKDNNKKKSKIRQNRFDPTSSTDGSETKNSNLKIPYRIIIQARQEMPLVKLQLSRHMKNEKGDYMSEDNFNEFPVSGKLPSHYYQEVPCCLNCYKVYEMISEARKSALTKIRLSRDKHRDERGRSLSPSNSHVSSIHNINTYDEIAKDRSKESLLAAVAAIDSLTKLDVAEIKTMVKPPAAVEVVLEAVMCLLVGKPMTWNETRKLLGGGEAFLVMLRDFKLEDVTDVRLRLVEPYVDNPVFRPENVLPVSYCASKFCAWVFGIVQAATWQRGSGHSRVDVLKLNENSVISVESKSSKKGGKPFSGSLSLDESSVEELTFVQKLEKKKAIREQQQANKAHAEEPMRGKRGRAGSPSKVISSSVSGPSLVDPLTASPLKKASKREISALAQSQKKSANRLSSHNKSEGNLSSVGSSKEFLCNDGITTIPYVILGQLTLNIRRCNFVVVHDFFDSCDATAILFKAIAQRHDGCQILCFNYPGQSNTVWPRPPAVERERGAKDPILNNDWIADKLHELLQHAEEEGDILMSSPFHLVGMGNGSCIASAFCQRWGSDKRYVNSLRSLVSFNGFLYPDPQLTSILHSAVQVFESAPHNRPDIPVSYWTRFVFSEDYLAKINPNLALNIYTAVSNPITNDGRTKITKGCLQHRDLRGGLAPDNILPKASGISLKNVQVPVIIVQATENVLVNAANVDPFLVGRNTKHLWSHQLNILSQAKLSQAMDVNAQWVGKMSSGTEDYQKFSILGKTGLRMLLDTLSNPRGAFVMWVRSGHIIQQELKAGFLDLIDALASPTEEYLGFNEEVDPSSALTLTAPSITSVAPSRDKSEIESSVASKMEVMFKIIPPKHLVKAGKIAPTNLEEHEMDLDAMAEDAIVSDEILDQKTKPDEESVMQAIPTTTTSKDDKPEEKLKPVTDEKLKPLTDVKTIEITNSPEKLVEKPAPKTTITSPARVESSSPAKLVDNASLESVSTNLDSPPSKPQSLPISSTEKNNEVADNETVLQTHSTDSHSPSRRDNISDASKNFSTDIIQDKKVESLPKIETKKEETKESPIRISSPPKKQPVVAEIEEPSIMSPTSSLISTGKQRASKKWTDTVPDISTTLELEADLAKRQKEFYDLEAKQRNSLAAEAAAKIERFKQEQQLRREEYEEQDKQLIAKLQVELEERRRERDNAEKQRRLEIQQIEDALLKGSLIQSFEETHQGEQVPVKEMPPMRYDEPNALPAAMVIASDITSQLDSMVKDEEEARKKGSMSLEAFEEVKRKMAQRQMERDQKLKALAGAEQHQYFIDASCLIQRVARGYNARKRVAILVERRKMQRKLNRRIILAQALARGMVTRKRFRAMRSNFFANILKGKSAILIQRVFRGFLARRIFRRRRRIAAAINLQRVFRGHIGRRVCKRERARLAILRKKQVSASKIQSCWRMKVAKEEFRSLRIHMLAAIEMQRIYRGHLGRKQVKRRRKWEATAPGPERIKLGLQLIEESKIAFERQQEEIDSLHRAQERAEARISHIHSELQDSEKELSVLERELLEIDQIENDLLTLTHEKDILSKGITDATGMPRTALRGHEDLILGHESNSSNDPDHERRRKAEAYALEMTIQVKRAEREKKRQELETEFAIIFKEVDKKRKALERLEVALADMESTRERKDREFRRLQKNLMQLLLEQKMELDELREKGIELETATSMTAAAAAATAQKAKEHEQRSTVMFSQTEELMKFQFMSMSLSYFSSLNMLKQLRDMNSDTTATAVSSSADAAAAAAAAATAANLPNIKKLNLGADDFVELNLQKKKAELMVSDAAEKETKTSKEAPMPDNVRMWTVNDVCRWLDAIFLGQYAPAFKEACVDGPFLLELREEDMVQVLGMKHKLHVRKIIVSREKLKPLSEQEKFIKDQVEQEEKAKARRKDQGVPDLDTVFSQARNGRVKRVEESLNLSFPVDSEDERGNTLLLVAAQNSNKKLVEMLLVRGANINHQNAQGNTALHFAIAFDSEGQLGEYLIEHGADDTIENVDGLSAYDGVSS